MNTATVIVLLAIVCAVSGAVLTLRKSRGRGGCSGGCEGCARKGQCKK